VVVSGLVAAWLASPVAAGATATPPVLNVVRPVPFESFPAGSVQMSGQASSAAGIASVRIQITDAYTHQTTGVNAMLGRRSGSTTPWTYMWQPSAADTFFVRVQAYAIGGSASSAVSEEIDVASSSGPQYLTLLFGRSQLAAADQSCQPLPGTVPLDQVAATLKTMKLHGTGSIVTSYIADNATTCVNDGQGNDLYPSWQQLDNLRDADGMTFVSQGINYADVRTLSTPQQEADICGSLPILEAHGHVRAWGLFGYPNNHYTAAIQSGVTANCFAYGRSYASIRNHASALAASPFVADGFSLLGGACNAPSLACYSLSVIGPTTGKETRYQSPLDLASMMNVGHGEWSIVQMYTFVTGAHNVGGTGVQWDCTSADWHAHFTTDTEVYCWNDYVQALSSLPAGIVVTDPATVARTYFPSTSAPVAAITSGPSPVTNQTSATFSFTANQSRVWYLCSLDGAPPQVCDSGVTYSGLPNGKHTFALTATDPFGDAGTANWSWTVTTVGA
jgi:hypothetical protein